MSRCASMQASARDRTKGPVGLSGTVLEARVIHPRASGDSATLEAAIQCGEIRCHVSKVFDSVADATKAMRLIPAGSHLSAFGEAPNLHMRGGELHLATQRWITYSLVSDFTQRNQATEVAA